MSATRILQSCRRCGARERTVLSTRCVVLDALVHQSGLCCLHAMWCWTVWCTRVDCIVYVLCGAGRHGAPEWTVLSTCYVVLDGVVHHSGLCCLRAVWCWMVWCTRVDCVVYMLCGADGVVHQSGLCCLCTVWCWMVWCTRADCVVYTLCGAGWFGAPERTLLSTCCVVLDGVVYQSGLCCLRAM